MDQFFSSVKQESKVGSTQTQGNTSPSRFIFGQNISFMGFLAAFLTFLKTPISLLVRRPVIQLIALALAVQFGTYIGSWLLCNVVANRISGVTNRIKLAALYCYCRQERQAELLGQALLWTVSGKNNESKVFGSKPAPEYRVPYLMLTISATAGLLLYTLGRSEMLLHWIAVDSGVLILPWASFMSAGALNAYLFDEFPQGMPLAISLRALPY